MGYLILFGLTVTPAVLWHWAFWRRRVKSKLRRLLGFGLCSVAASITTAAVIAAIGRLVDGKLLEPVRYVGFLTVMALPYSALLGLPFLLFPRPHPEGFCRQCGYCLAGLTEMRCPECGRAFGKELLREPSGETDQTSPPTTTRHGQSPRSGRQRLAQGEALGMVATLTSKPAQRGDRTSRESPATPRAFTPFRTMQVL